MARPRCWSIWLAAATFFCWCQIADLKFSGSDPKRKARGGPGGAGGAGGGPIELVDRRQLAFITDDNEYVAALFLDSGQQFKSDRISDGLEKARGPKLQACPQYRNF